MGQYKGLETDNIGRVYTQAAVGQAVAELMASGEGQDLARRAVAAVANTVTAHKQGLLGDDKSMRDEARKVLGEFAQEVPGDLVPPGIRGDADVQAAFRRVVIATAGIEAGAIQARDERDEDRSARAGLWEQGAQLLRTLRTETGLPTTVGTLAPGEFYRHLSDGLGRVQTEEAIAAAAQALRGSVIASHVAVGASNAVHDNRTDDETAKMAIQGVLEKVGKEEFPEELLPAGIAGGAYWNLSSPFARKVLARAGAEDARAEAQRWHEDENLGAEELHAKTAELLDAVVPEIGPTLGDKLSNVPQVAELGTIAATR